MALVVLAVAWAAFLIHQVLRARAEGSPADSVGAFRKQLSVLQRTSPAAGGARLVSLERPRDLAYDRYRSRRSLVRKRRRDILLGLLAAMSGSLALGLIPGLRVMLVLHVGLDLLCAVYVALLIRARNLAEERSMKVRYLPGTVHAEPAMLLQRSAN